MFTQTFATASGLDSDQLHSFVFNELIKNADGVRAAPNTGDDASRQLAFSFKNLRACFFPGYLVKIAHHGWIRMRSQYTAEKIMSCASVGYPIAHGLIDRVFQGA